MASATVIRVLAILCICTSLAAQEWRSGDPHVHVQTCDFTDPDLNEVLVEMSVAELDFEALQLWARYGDLPGYLVAAPLITGADVAPGVRYGVEVSGFPASQFGHLQILDCTDGNFPVLALHSGPILAYYDAALTGYAHVRWNEDYAPVPFYGGVGGAYTAPIDAALRQIDFIETMEVEWGMPTTWRGMYYKLMNAGLRTSLAAGSDNTCGSLDGVGNPRTWVQADTYDGLCDEIRAGRTSISDPGAGRLELAVGTSLSATLHAPTMPGTLSILANGVSVASMSYSATGGSVGLVVPLPPQSAWVAARAAGAHTAAQWVIVGDEPVAVAQDAAYWRDYCDAFADNLGTFNVPSAEAELDARIGQARAVYAALLARASPWPRWASEYGPSTPACHGPISIGVVGTQVDCLGAPGNATGYLLLGVAPASIATSGITVLVNPTLPYLLLPVTTSSGGYAQTAVAVPSGRQFYCQFIWTSPCGGPLSASDGLSAVMP